MKRMKNVIEVKELGENILKISFPGGHFELARTKEDYWAHICIDRADSVVDTRVDYELPCRLVSDMTLLPSSELINHVAMRIRERS